MKEQSEFEKMVFAFLTPEFKRGYIMGIQARRKDEEDKKIAILKKEDSND